MAETPHIDGIRAVVGSQFCSQWWQFGAQGPDRTTDTAIFQK
jgi:hypothetical protein